VETDQSILRLHWNKHWRIKFVLAEAKNYITLVYNTERVFLPKNLPTRFGATFCVNAVDPHTNTRTIRLLLIVLKIYLVLFIKVLIV